MILSKTSINRPVMISMFISAMVLMGVLAYLKLPLNSMPEVDIPVITVQVIYPGAGPEEIETNITKKIEDEVATIAGLDKVESFMMTNVNTTVITFKSDKDADEANREVKEKIDAIEGEFPDDSEKPVIAKFDINAAPILDLSFISTMNSKKAFEFVDKQVKDRLSRINGVSKVELRGGQEREIQVILNKSNMEKYHISPLQVMAFIKQNNLSMPSGNINKKGAEFSVKVDGEIVTINDLNEMKIMTPVGSRKLRDIAEIKDAGKRIEKLANFYRKGVKRAENETVINLEIKKQSDANTVLTATAVKEEIKRLNTILPDGARLEIGRDGSTFVENNVNDTTNAIYMGIFFTALVLFLFLHNLSTTLIAAVSMPVVLVSTFLLVGYSGYSLNTMTLMALSVSVGTLVTNSVVIIENIMKYISRGYSRVDAADKGTAEIAVAVIASTMTNVVVFIPIASMESVVGQFFVEFGMTVTFIMLFSIIISFTLTPMMAAKMLKEKKKDDIVKKKGLSYHFNRLFDSFTLKYRNVLAVMIATTTRRLSMIAVSIAILVVTVMIVGPSLGGEFLPFVDDGDLEVKIELPTYYEIERTDVVFAGIENIITSHEEVEKVITNIGVLGKSQGSNMGAIKIKLVDKKLRDKSTDDMLRIFSQELVNIPDGRIKVSKISSVAGPGGGDPIELRISGDNIAELKKLAKKVESIVKQVPGTSNVDTDIRAGKPEIKIIPIRKKISDYNTSVSDIALTVRASVEGLKASVYKENGEEYDIKIKMDQLDIEDFEKIKNLVVLTKKGNVKVSELAEVVFTEAPTMITRIDKMKTYKVTASDAGRTIGDIMADINRKIAEEIEIPEGYRITAGGDVERMNDANKDFSGALLLAIVLTFMLITAILESFVQTILIMSTLPLALIGVLWALYFTGISLNIFSMMAGVMLIGIVVNNAILVLDYANQLMRDGISKMEAILEACQSKMKAVIMATLASAFGMLPLALGIGKGAELRQGMGVVSIGGLIMSSILTMIVIPALYAQFTRKHKKKVKV